MLGCVWGLRSDPGDLAAPPGNRVCAFGVRGDNKVQFFLSVKTRMQSLSGARGLLSHRAAGQRTPKS